MRTWGYSSALVSMWVNGKRWPNGDNRVRIAELTDGAVPVTAWNRKRRSNGKHDTSTVRRENLNVK